VKMYQNTAADATGFFSFARFFERGENHCREKRYAIFLTP